jgi:hypothetical protein
MFLMAKRGRPRKDERWRKCERVDLRVDAAEKEAFRLAANQANQELSVWIRMQLHKAVGQELGGLDDTKVTGQEMPTDKDRAANVRNDGQT